MSNATQIVNKLIDAGYSQPQLAQIANTTQATISRISKGASTSYEIGKALEVELMNLAELKRAS